MPSDNNQDWMAWLVSIIAGAVGLGAAAWAANQNQNQTKPQSQSQQNTNPAPVKKPGVPCGCGKS